MKTATCLALGALFLTGAAAGDASAASRHHVSRHHRMHYAHRYRERFLGYARPAYLEPSAPYYSQSSEPPPFAYVPPAWDTSPAAIVARATIRAQAEPGLTSELAPDAKQTATGGPVGGVPGLSGF